MKDKELEDLLQKEYLRGFAEAEKKYNSVIAENIKMQEKLKSKRICKQIMRCKYGYTSRRICKNRTGRNR